MCCILSSVGIFLKHPTADFSDEEIHKAVFQLSQGKAPGPHGHTAEFFQQLWPLIKEKITQAIKFFAVNHRRPKYWNTTTLALIAKGLHPTEAQDFRPISLCNSIFKILSRVLVNRWRQVTDSVTNEAQLRFVWRRGHGWYHDCARILVVCFQQRNKNSKHIKVDTQKTYDRLNWIFLERMISLWAITIFGLSRYSLCHNSNSNFLYVCEQRASTTFQTAQWPPARRSSFCPLLYHQCASFASIYCGSNSIQSAAGL